MYYILLFVVFFALPIMLLHYYIYDTCTFVDIIASCYNFFLFCVCLLFIFGSSFCILHCLCLYIHTVLLPYLLYFQCHINVFIIFFSFHSHSLSLSYVLSFHFISSVCSIKVAFLMPHSVFSATYFGFAVCHACAKRKTNNTFETRTRIMKVVRMNHHSILTMRYD